MTAPPSCSRDPHFRLAPLLIGVLTTLFVLTPTTAAAAPPGRGFFVTSFAPAYFHDVAATIATFAYERYWFDQSTHTVHTRQDVGLFPSGQGVIIAGMVNYENGASTRTKVCPFAGRTSIRTFLYTSTGPGSGSGHFASCAFALTNPDEADNLQASSTVQSFTLELRRTSVPGAAYGWRVQIDAAFFGGMPTATISRPSTGLGPTRVRTSYDLKLWIERTWKERAKEAAEVWNNAARSGYSRSSNRTLIARQGREQTSALSYSG